MSKLKEKIQEAITAVAPITLLVLMLSILVVPMEITAVAMFFLGALLLVLGMGFFQLGSEIAMTPLGEGMGIGLSKSGKIVPIVLISFAMGFIITVAEPDLQVLANQVPSIPNSVLIYSVAMGVGVFLTIGILRILLKWSLSKILVIFYSLLFIVSIFAPNEFLSVAFDAGGVTTGPITVPFIMAMGLGIASIRSDKDAADDSFGLVALASAGPILAVMLLGILFNPQEATYTQVEIPDVVTTRDMAKQFADALPHYVREVTMCILPILGVFILMEIFTKRYKQRQTIRMLIGLLYTFIGLVLFLAGVNVGFMPVGNLLGGELAASPEKRWLLVPVGMLIGYFIVAAEPAVQVLNRQVEDVTDGAIPRSIMNKCLSIGVSISVGLSMVRVLTGISIYWILVPGYVIAIALSFFVPKIFVGIAFDSGGVASGPMTSTFLLPLAMGASEGVGGNVMTDAFGIVAFVAMTPLVAVQAMGILYKIRLKRAEALEIQETTDGVEDEFFEYEEEISDDD